MSKRITNLAAVLFLGIVAICDALGVFTGWGMSEPAATALVILLVAATLWVSELVPLFVTSFVILLLAATWLHASLQAAGVEIAREEFFAPFASDIIMLFLGGFVLSAGLNRFRLDELMARWVIDHTGQSVPRLLLGIMGITAVLSMFLSNTATAAMMIALCLPIVRQLPAGDRSRKAVLLAVPFAANVGGMGTPIGSPPNAIAIEYLKPLGAAPDFVTWMILGVPLVVVMLAVAWAVLLLVFPGYRGPVTLDEEDRDPIRIGARGTIVIAVAALTILGWMTGRFHGLSPGTVAVVPVVILFGLKLLDVRDLRALSWDVLLVMGGGLCLGRAVAVSGLAAWLVEQLPTEGVGPAAIIAVFGITAAVMSSFMSNTAAANLIMPIIVGLGTENVPPMLVAVAFCCSLAMALPISTPPNAIAFSSGELRSSDLTRPGLVVTIVGIGLVLTAGTWWWSLVGLGAR